MRSSFLITFMLALFRTESVGFRRPCKNCGNKFQPKSRFSRTCDKCYEKIQKSIKRKLRKRKGIRNGNIGGNVLKNIYWRSENKPKNTTKFINLTFV